VSLTRAQRARDAARIAGITWGRAGALGSNSTVHLQFCALKRSRVLPAPEQRSLRGQRRRASAAQLEEGKARAPARVRCAAARGWVLCLRMFETALAGTPARPDAAHIKRRERRLLHHDDAPPSKARTPRAQHGSCRVSAAPATRKREAAASGRDIHRK